MVFIYKDAEVSVAIHPVSGNATLVISVVDSEEGTLHAQRVEGSAILFCAAIDLSSNFFAKHRS